MNSGLQLASMTTGEAARSICTACGGREWDCFFEIPQLPVNCIALLPTRNAALACPKGEIQLGFCRRCGAVRNLAFDGGRLTYDPSYDNSLHFSPTFRNYTEQIARDLIERYQLRDKTIIDVGCGNAEFLALLCGLGNNRGVGFDPTFIAGRADLKAGQGISIIPDYYSERYREYAADFVVCRHVLEHIIEPRRFLGSVRRALRGNSDAAIFFELPNASFVFQSEGMWDVIYEHCFYYSSGALARLFSTCGFDVSNVAPTFNGQYLFLEARVSSREIGLLGEAGGDLESMRSEVRRFAQDYDARRTYWAEILQNFAAQRQRVALWGAGAKGSMFLNAFRDSHCIEYVVDVNPHKHGLYIPGTGQEVVAPGFLQQLRPDVVLIVNPNYRDEISVEVRSLGITPDLLSV